MSATRRPILDAKGIGPAFSQIATSASLKGGEGCGPGEAIAGLSDNPRKRTPRSCAATSTDIVR
ncbi:hypothetical protein AJ87_35640 [Rhizobium yanglingense]|nr:hypothetical protein AJ87_35640 [Rhizobium yanglingense]